MNVLGLDSATEACSAAVLVNGVTMAHRFETLQRGHAEILMPMVRAVMTEAALRFDQLDLIATTVGPGGFTGLRIGLASARALALAAHVPLIGVTTLEAVARAQLTGDGPILVALDTKRADVYVQIFNRAGAPLTEPGALLSEEIAAILPDGPLAIAGNARDLVLTVLQDRHPPPRAAVGPALPDAAIVAAVGLERFRAQPNAATRPPSPLYLRPPDARLPGEPLA